MTTTTSRRISATGPYADSGLGGPTNSRASRITSGSVELRRMDEHAVAARAIRIPSASSRAEGLSEFVFTYTGSRLVLRTF